MPGKLSKLTGRLMGRRSGVAANSAAEETEVLESSVLRPKIGYLSAMELFRDFTPAEMAEIVRATRMQTCKSGRIFYTPGETGEVLFLLKTGAAQIYRMSPEGRKLVIARLPPYSFFGEMSCIGQGMYDTFAEAAEDSLICTMSRADGGAPAAGEAAGQFAHPRSRRPSHGRSRAAVGGDRLQRTHPAPRRAAPARSRRR